MSTYGLSIAKASRNGFPHRSTRWERGELWACVTFAGRCRVSRTSAPLRSERVKPSHALGEPERNANVPFTRSCADWDSRSDETSLGCPESQTSCLLRIGRWSFATETSGTARRWSERRAALLRGANATYWLAKIESNRARDTRHSRELRRLGWRVIRVWEGDIRKHVANVAQRIVRRMAGGGSLCVARPRGRPLTHRHVGLARSETVRR